MKEIREYTKFFPKLALVLLLVLALPLYLVNDGLYFSETKDRVEVTYTEESENKIRKIGPIAKVDRENMVITFQNIDTQNLEEKVNRILEENEDIEEINYSFISRSSELEQIYFTIGKVSLALVVTLVLLNIYRQYRKLENKIDYYSIGKFSIYLVSFFVLSVTSTFSVLGLLSRFFFVKTTDIYLSLLILIGISIYINYIINSSTKLSFEDFKINLNAWIENNSKFLAIISIIIIFPLFFALGINFVIPGLLIVLFLLLNLELLLNLNFAEEFASEKLEGRKNKVSIPLVSKGKPTKKTHRGAKNWKNRFNKKRK